MEEEKIYFQAIASNFYPPYSKIISLYKKFKSFKKIYEILEKNLKVKKDWEKEYQKLKKINGDIILRKNLPKELKSIKDTILGLFILGNFNINYPLKISIVGTRKASEIGQKTSFLFAKKLSEIGALIISGLAYGIDLAAHKGVLSIKNQTIAVIGCGLDVILKDPRRKIIDQILEFKGSIISEYPLGSPALANHFPLRNRIIAALSDGILVIEAPIDSGSLITCRYGIEYNKEIFIIPGSIYDKNYHGSLKLIQEGAKLIIEPEDILKEFDFKIPHKIKNLSLSPKENLIVEKLKSGGLTIQELIDKTKLPANEILSLLSHLEIKGVIFSENGKFYSSLK
jgi:DNA processing protein